MALEHKMIEPFAPALSREGVISFGVSAYGYDLRMADEFRVFANYISGDMLDPKRFDETMFVKQRGATAPRQWGTTRLASLIQTLDRRSLDRITGYGTRDYRVRHPVVGRTKGSSRKEAQKAQERRGFPLALSCASLRQYVLTQCGARSIWLRPQAASGAVC